MNILKNELLKNHTSFKIGGPADEFCEVASMDEIPELIEYAKEKNIPYTIIGNGSNLLVGDKGIRGLVIKIAKGFDNVAHFNGVLFCHMVPSLKFNGVSKHRTADGPVSSIVLCLEKIRTGRDYRPVRIQYND